MGAPTLRVMSFNIRGFSRRGDGINTWRNRAALNVATIRRYAPTVIGLQEVRAESLATYRDELPEYTSILGPRAGGDPPLESNAILFDPARLEVLDSDGFWLSETPDAPSSAWRARVVRSANWARFRCLDHDLAFLHLNTHLDHLSSLARAKGSELIVDRLRVLQEDGLSAVVTGDFNCRPGSRPYRTFAESGFADTFLAAGNEDEAEATTFHGFHRLPYSALRWAGGKRSGRRPLRIDWILVRSGRQQIRAESHAILRDRDPRSAIYPSDHYPVLATLSVDAEPESSQRGSGHLGREISERRS